VDGVTEKSVCAFNGARVHHQQDSKTNGCQNSSCSADRIHFAIITCARFAGRRRFLFYSAYGTRTKSRQFLHGRSVCIYSRTLWEIFLYVGNRVRCGIRVRSYFLESRGGLRPVFTWLREIAISLPSRGNNDRSPWRCRKQTSSQQPEAKIVRASCATINLPYPV